MSEKFENLIEKHLFKLEIGNYGYYGSNGNSFTTKAFLFIILEKLISISHEKNYSTENIEKLKSYRDKFLLKSEYNYENNLIDFLNTFETTLK